MDKSLSQEEIDALFNQANESNNIVEKEEQKIDSKVESLLDYKYNENAEMIKKLFEENKNLNNDDLVNYKKSPYYQTYLYIYNNMESIIVSAIQQIEREYRYMESINFLSDGSLSRMKKELLFPNFILAQVVYEDFLNKIKEIIDANKTIDDIKLDVGIKKIDYVSPHEKANIAKRVDGYKIIINVKRQEKIK